MNAGQPDPSKAGSEEGMAAATNPTVGQRFTDKTVLVTGAASGIGLTTATRFAQEGARVVIVDLHGPAAAQAAQGLRRAGAAAVLGLGCDVSQPDQVKSCVTTVLNEFQRLDVIVNSAGPLTYKPLVELCLSDWLHALQVDLLGAFLFIKQAFLHMPRGGAIVNVAGVNAHEASPLLAPYAAARAALVSLTRSAAIEGRSRGIRVNAVLPGAIDTPILWDNPYIRSGLERLDPGDVGSPEDLGAAITFLASPDAAFVNGEALALDGGLLPSRIPLPGHARREGI